MESQNIPASLSCGKCGSNAITIPDNPDESFMVKCDACGTDIGKWGDIRVAAAEHVKEAIEKKLKDELRKAFEGNDNIRFE
jgi:hypothetical protein